LTDSIPAVLGNRTQLRQVLSNIVRNAIEAMSTTFDKVRMLRIKTAPYEDGVAVSVEDSGPGIDPTMVETLFDAFVTTKSYGTGLGLAICRMIVHHHGGQLKASSNDSGALFQVVLPTISDAQPKSAD
jgi:C4-dicarboxylate-specific signal transduction histidine kinase